MTMLTKTGQFNASTVTGNQSVTGMGFAPRALIFWTVGATNNDEFNTVSFAQGIGFTTGPSNSYAQSSIAATTASTATYRRVESVAILQTDSTATLVLRRADLVSLDSDGFTVNWTAAITSGGFGIIHYLALGGSDLTGARVVNWQMPGTAGAKAVTGVGFQPDCVIHAHAGGVTTLNANATAQATFGLGVMTANGDQWATAYAGNSTSANARDQETNQTITLVDTAGSVSAQAAFGSMDSDGFSLNFSIAGGVYQSISLCLKGGRYKAGRFIKSTATAPVAQAVTGTGFAPKAVLLAGVEDIVRTGGLTGAMAFGLGATDGTSGFATSLYGAATATRTNNDDSAKVYTKDNGAKTVVAEAGMSSIDTDGFTLGWTTNDAVATSILSLAFGGSTVAAMAYRETILATAGLVSYWRLGGNLTAETGGITGTGTYAAATGLLATGADPAISLNGTSQFVTFAGVRHFSGTAPCTFELLVKPTGFPAQYAKLLSWEQGGGYAIYSDHAANYYQFARTDGAGGVGVSGGTPTVGAVAHLVGRYNGSTMELFLNGVSVASAPDARSIPVGTGALTLGRLDASASQYLAGVLDEVSIYNVALSNATIQEHYLSANSASANILAVTATSTAPVLSALAGASGMMAASIATATAPTLTATAINPVTAMIAAATGVVISPMLTATVNAFSVLLAALGSGTAPVVIVTTKPASYASALLTVALASSAAPNPAMSAGSRAGIVAALGSGVLQSPVAGQIFPSFSTLVAALGSGMASPLSVTAASRATLLAALGSGSVPLLTAKSDALSSLLAAFAGSGSAPTVVITGVSRAALLVAGATCYGPALAARGTATAFLLVAAGSGQAPKLTVIVITLPQGVRVTNVLSPGGAYAVQVVLWRASRDGRKLELVPSSIPVSGVISANEDTQVKRTLSLSVNDPHWLTPYNDYVIPEITLTDASGVRAIRQMGHYIVLPPSTTLTPGRLTGTIEAQGVIFLLANDTLDDGLLVLTGTDTGAAARQIALDGGLTSMQIALPDTGVLLAANLFLPPGMTRLTAITNLYSTAGWYAPWSDATGIIRTRHYNSTGVLTPRIRYSTNDANMKLVPPIGETPDVSRLRNRVTVRNLSPNKPVIYWTEEITNQSHPLHHDNIGLWLSETVDDGQIPDEAAAKAKARALLANGASYYRKVTIETVPDLDADLHDVIGLDVTHGGLTYDGAWMRRTWKLNIGGIVGTTRSELFRTEGWQ
ncbi:MAG: LamG domain-containing protein [Gemmatimonadaceae bacterium]